MTKQAKAKFDKGASAKRAAECLFHVDEAERTSAKFKLEFSQEIAKAKHNGVKSWGGARYPGSYGAGTYHGLTFCLWPKDAEGKVLPNEKIGDDTLKTLTKRRDNLMLVGKDRKSTV